MVLPTVLTPPPAGAVAAYRVHVAGWSAAVGLEEEAPLEVAVWDCAAVCRRVLDGCELGVGRM